MTLLLRKFTQNQIRHIITKHSETQLYVISSRKLSLVPYLYDGDEDPAPKFFSSNVQVLLRRLTRPNFDKVFRKRTSGNYPVLKTPKYTFLTDEELREQRAIANRKADELLQMPPVVKVQAHIDDVLSRDPALIGYDTSTYLFTDITFGVPNEKRIIVQRDPDGTLQSCDHDIRKRLNQVYFPINGRKLREPQMFTNPDLFDSLLEREEYEFVLDRACVQYEPDESTFQKITSLTYQHLDNRRKYDILRSTRHFGPLVFYLSWTQSTDQLMLELMQTGTVREGALLMAARLAIRGDLPETSVGDQLVQQILATPIQLEKPERLTEEDIQLDNKCVECIEKYITNSSTIRSQHELALQGFREYYQQMIDVSRGLQKAHGKM